MVKNHWKNQPRCTASHLADKSDQIQTQEDWLADLIRGGGEGVEGLIRNTNLCEGRGKEKDGGSLPQWF